MFEHLRYWAALWVGLSLTQSVQAQPFTPLSKDTVVARWERLAKTGDELERIEQLLSKANKPGNAGRYYGQAEALLNRIADQPLAQQPSARQMITFHRAKISQYHHQFEQALTYLNEVISREPTHINALLMRANIEMTIGQFDRAKRTCLSLLDKVAMAVSAACSLQVSAQQSPSSDSYQQLLLITERAGQLTPEVAIWMKEVLAEMALNADQPEQALEHLSGVSLQHVPVSFLALWGDVQLAMQQPQHVLSTLGPIVERSSVYDDALLYRLALAEKRSAEKSKQWSDVFTQRIKLRILREDDAHAADIAHYFMAISPDPVRALYWANKNWQHARLKADRELLKRAQSLQQTKPEQSI